MHKTTGEVWDKWRLVILSANHAVFHAQNDRGGLGHLGTCNSKLQVAVFLEKTTDEGWDR